MADVTLTHPDSKLKITVPEDQADKYRSQGWSEPESKKADDKK